MSVEKRSRIEESWHVFRLDTEDDQRISFSLPDSVVLRLKLIQ